jgi:hypothetical protein
MRLAAHLVAFSIAAYYGKHTSLNFGSDTVDFGDKPNIWKDIADYQLSLYNQFFGIGEDVIVDAGGTWGEMDTKLSTGDEYVYHSGRAR